MEGNKIKSSGWLVGRALVRFLILIILIRLVRDTSFRMLFPFLPVYARGFGITLTAAGTSDDGADVAGSARTVFWQQS